MTPEDRVAQLYPQALGTHFGRLLRHAWVTVGLFFNPGHHTGTMISYHTSFQDRILNVASVGPNSQVLELTVLWVVAPCSIVESD
jgi:hypothetical protein